MLRDGNRQIQEYVDGLTFTTVYEQDSFVPVARLVSKDDELKVYYYHTDHFGTPNELTDEKGEVVWLADYNAWGGISKICEDFHYKTQFIGNVDISSEQLQPLRFQGQYVDEETGLHYNRFRYYDNDVGMFVSRDPIGLNGGFNTFAYVKNPVQWIDPLGLQPIDKEGFYDPSCAWYESVLSTPRTPLFNHNPKLFSQKTVLDFLLTINKS